MMKLGSKPTPSVKILISGTHLKYPDLIDMRCDLDTGIFETPQATLMCTKFGNFCLVVLPLVPCLYYTGVIVGREQGGQASWDRDAVEE